MNLDDLSPDEQAILLCMRALGKGHYRLCDPRIMGCISAMIELIGPDAAINVAEHARAYALSYALDHRKTRRKQNTRHPRPPDTPP